MTGFSHFLPRFGRTFAVAENVHRFIAAVDEFALPVEPQGGCA
jgi:hypothetical protein